MEEKREFRPRARGSSDTFFRAVQGIEKVVCLRENFPQ